MVALDEINGWEIWTDITTKNHYYYHRPTNECRWDKPTRLLELVLEDQGIWGKKVEPHTSREYYYNKDSLQCTWEAPAIVLAAEYTNPEDEMKSGFIDNIDLENLNLSKIGNEAVASTCATCEDLWVPIDDPETGKTYYYNTETGVSSWTKPQTNSARSDVMEVVDTENDGWEMYEDEVSGRLYYFNQSTNTASWEKPDLHHWEEHTDPETNSKYYHHTMCNITQWSKPSGWQKAAGPEGSLDISDEGATITPDHPGKEVEEKHSVPAEMACVRSLSDTARLLSPIPGEDGDNENEIEVNTRMDPTSKHEKDVDEGVEPHEFEEPPRKIQPTKGDVDDGAVDQASWPCILRTSGALFVKCASDCGDGTWVQRFFRIEEGIQLVCYKSTEATAHCYKIDLANMEVSLGSVSIGHRTYFRLSLSKSSARQEEIAHETYHFRAPDEPRMWEWVVSLSIAVKPGISTLPLAFSWDKSVLRLTEQVLKYLSIRQALSQPEVEVQMPRELLQNTDHFNKAGSSWMLLKGANLGVPKCSLVSRINDRRILQMAYRDSLDYLLGSRLNGPLIRLGLRPFPNVTFYSLYKFLQPRGSKFSQWIQGRFELRDGALYYGELDSLHPLDLLDANVSLVPSTTLPFAPKSGKPQEVYLVISDKLSTHLVLNLPSFQELIIWGKEIFLGITIVSGGDKDLSMAFDSAAAQGDSFKGLEYEMDGSVTWTVERILSEDSDITTLVSRVSHLFSGLDCSEPDGLENVEMRLRETAGQVVDTTFKAISKLRSSIKSLNPQTSPILSPRSPQSRQKGEPIGKDDLSRYQKLIQYLVNNSKSIVNIAWGLPCKIRDAFMEIIVHCILGRYNDLSGSVIFTLREAVNKNKVTGGHGLQIKHIQKLMHHRPVVKDGADPSSNDILHALVLSMLSRAEISGYMKLLIAPSLEWLSSELPRYSQESGDSTPMESLAFTLVQQILCRLIDPDEALKPPPVLLGIYEVLWEERQAPEKFFCDILLLPLLTQAIGSGEPYNGIDIYKPNLRRLDPLHLLPQKAQVDLKLFGCDPERFSFLIQKYIILIFSPTLVVDDFSLRRRAALANLQVMMKGFINNVLKKPKLDATMPHDLLSPISCVLLRSEIQVLHMFTYFHICHYSGQGEEQTHLSEILQGLGSPFESLTKGKHERDETVVFTVEIPAGKEGKRERTEELSKVINAAKVLVEKLQEPLSKREQWRVEKEGKKVLLSVLRIEDQVLEALKSTHRLRLKEQILQLYKAQLDLFIEAFPLVYYARTAMDAEANKQFELGRSLITKRYSDLLTREASLNTTLRRSFNDSGT